MVPPLMKTILDLFSSFVTIGGAMWAIFGIVTLAGGLKDHNGPQTQSGVWQIVGGAMILAAGVLFKTLVPL